MRLLCFLLLLGVLACIAAEPATYEAGDYTTWNRLRKVGDSKRGEIHVPLTTTDGSEDSIDMVRLDLVGDAYTRGYAHGALLTKEIVEFTGPQLDFYFAEEILGLDTSSFPDPLKKILDAAKIAGAIKAPALFREAMAWVWEKEKSFVPDVINQEMKGIADGVCKTIGHNCDSTEWLAKIQATNMLPELIRMACTAYGAWGKATPDQSLIQLRALDFGTGPFANNNIIQVHRGDPNNDNAFVSVSFPGFVGAITGVSKYGIGISEKVWMTYDFIGIQPGSYDGLADIFALRNILEFSKTRADAEAYINSIPRTWAMFVGIGDHSTGQFDLVGYRQSDAVVYNDVTMPAQTGQPFIENVCYVDKHPQPSGDGATGSLPTALQSFYGNITLDTTKSIVLAHQTGDVQIAAYNFKSDEMVVSTGKTNKKGQFGPEDSKDQSVWKAYNRPYVKFTLSDLWEGK